MSGGRRGPPRECGPARDAVPEAEPIHACTNLSLSLSLYLSLSLSLSLSIYIYIFLLLCISSFCSLTRLCLEVFLLNHFNSAVTFLGTVFDFPIVFCTSFDFRLYCPSWYYARLLYCIGWRPLVLRSLSFVLLLLRPLAGEISTVTERLPSSSPLIILTIGTR